MGGVFVYSIRYIKLNIITTILAFVSLFFSVYIFDPQYILSANSWTIKDFIIPVLTAYIGYALARTAKDRAIFRDVNFVYFIAVTYGVIQQICFYMEKLGEVLPWDASYLSSVLMKPNNFLQPGGLLRFFGTMNSFVEYQVTILFLGAFLWLNREKIKPSKLLFLNMSLMFVFLLLSLERSPLMMGLILMLFWKFKDLITNSKKLLNYTLASAFVSLLIILSGDFLASNSLTSGAYQRIYNVITFDLADDSAVRERINVQWKQALELARKNYFGIGPGRLSPATKEINPEGYVGPHNNFLAIYLAYGFLGFFLFAMLLGLGIWYFSYLNDEYRYFGYGMILAFASMAMFNMPYIGKQGIVFFFDLWILNRSKAL